MKNNEWIGFWVVQAVTLLSVIIPSVISFKKEDQQQFKWYILIIPIAFALCTVTFNYSTERKAQALSDTLDARDSSYKGSLNTQIQLAKDALDSLQNSLAKSNTLIASQGNMTSSLYKESVKTKNILMLGRKSLSNTFEGFSKLKNPLNNISVIASVEYDYKNFVGDRTRFANHTVFLDSVLRLANSEVINSEQDGKINSSDPNETISLKKNALVYRKNGKLSRLEFNVKPLTPSRLNHEFFPVSYQCSLDIYENLVYKNGLIDFSKSIPNTEYLSNGWEGQFERIRQVIDIENEKVEESFFIKFNKSYAIGDGVLSDKDLYKKNLALFFKFEAPMRAIHIAIRYDENGSKKITVPKSSIRNFNGYAVFRL